MIHPTNPKGPSTANPITAHLRRLLAALAALLALTGCGTDADPAEATAAVARHVDTARQEQTWNPDAYLPECGITAEDLEAALATVPLLLDPGDPNPLETFYSLGLIAYDDAEPLGSDRFAVAFRAVRIGDLPRQLEGTMEVQLTDDGWKIATCPTDFRLPPTFRAGTLTIPPTPREVIRDTTATTTTAPVRLYSVSCRYSNGAREVFAGHPLPFTELPLDEAQSLAETMEDGPSAVGRPFTCQPVQVQP